MLSKKNKDFVISNNGDKTLIESKYINAEISPVNDNYLYKIFFKDNTNTLMFNFYSLTYSELLIIGLTKYYYYIARYYSKTSDEELHDFMDYIEVNPNIIDENNMSTQLSRVENFVKDNKTTEYDYHMVMRFLIYSSHLSQDISDDEIDDVVNSCKNTFRKLNTRYVVSEKIFSINFIDLIYPIFMNLSWIEKYVLWINLWNNYRRKQKHHILRHEYLFFNLYNKDEVKLFVRLHCIFFNADNNKNVFVKDTRISTNEFFKEWAIKDEKGENSFKSLMSFLVNFCIDDVIQLKDRKRYNNFVENLTVDEYLKVENNLECMVDKHISVSNIIEFANIQLNNDDFITITDSEYNKVISIISQYYEEFKPFIKHFLDIYIINNDFDDQSIGFMTNKMYFMFVLHKYLTSLDTLNKDIVEEIVKSLMVSLNNSYNYIFNTNMLIMAIILIYKLELEQAFEIVLGCALDENISKYITIDNINNYLDNYNEYKDMPASWWIELV